MKKNNKRLELRLILSAIYLMIITILFVFSYKIFVDSNTPTPYQQSSSTDDYSYIVISKMSEKFAYSESTNIGIHFVVEKEDTGIWHTYLIAINEDDIGKYNKLIKYAKGETKTIPKPIKVYGYPVNINSQIKEMAIKNINNFLPSSNEVKITKDNYEDYLTNSYLDTTKKKQEIVNPLLTLTTTSLLVVLLLLILVIIDKDFIVDKIIIQKNKKEILDR